MAGGAVGCGEVMPLGDETRIASARAMVPYMSAPESETKL